MGTNLNRGPKSRKLTTLSKEQMAKIGGGCCCDMTPKERCEYNNVGRCGACDNEGIFTACA